MAVDENAKLTKPFSENDHFRGPKNARVNLVEYGDYECPHCRQVNDIRRELRARLGDKYRYIYRHFPITSTHSQSQIAAEAAEAASAQGKFWEMHNLLFKHQGELNQSQILQFAAEIDLDLERFERELDDGVYADRVREDFEGGMKSGVHGTPTFFINGNRYDGPWDLESLMAEIQKPLGAQVRVLFQQFTRLQASGGILLLITSILALIWANSPMAHYYYELLETHLTISLGSFHLSHELLEWVNDGLMVIFFFVVGLEIKRELTVGELASPRRAALPISAAVGGMIVPAVVYLIFNYTNEGQAGWGIPMATDIAFMLGVLTVFGKRIPLSLKVLFTALAIVDDIGAVLVIALFYTNEIVWIALMVAALIFLGLIVLNRAGVRSPLPYSILGIGLWLAFLESGLHPTIAGVLVAFTIPSRISANVEAFEAQCTAVLGGVEAKGPERVRVANSSRSQAAAMTLEAIAERIQTPAQRLERSLLPWVTYIILPIFAFANAGVTLQGDFMSTVTNPIAVGIILGLIVGKPLGIGFFSWLAVKSRLADLPMNVGWPQLISTSFLAGIGFTMALFIASAAFSDPALLSIAKLSIILASLLAGLIGSVLLLFTSSSKESTTEMETAPAVV
jgi:NhaA family Na+:H+ antiporter